MTHFFALRDDRTDDNLPRRPETRSHSSTCFLELGCNSSLIIVPQPRRRAAQRSRGTCRFGANARLDLIICSSELNQGEAVRSLISAPGFCTTMIGNTLDWDAEPVDLQRGSSSIDTTLISKVVRTLTISNNPINFCRPAAAMLKKPVEAYS